MKVAIDRGWTDGFLDYHREPGDYLIECMAWKNLERLQGIYYERLRNPWIVWNYLRDIGPRHTIRKILSRTQERYRNEKYAACGIGSIQEGPNQGSLRNGQVVVFIAPCCPRAVERIVLPEALVLRLNSNDFSFLPREEGILFCEDPEPTAVEERWWCPIGAWSPHSGAILSEVLCGTLLSKALGSLRKTDWKGAKILPGGRTSPKSREVSARAVEKGRKSAVLFGYGNYAKNIILPNVQKYVDVRCIHEIDPLQIPLNRSERYAWSTAAKIEEDENYDVFLIAGFHHTHAPLAIEGLKRGASVLVEKPIAVDRAQLTALSEIMSKSSGKLFCCFHKRFSPFNSLIKEDLCLQRGQPVSYHCIIFEAPLPPHHWYNWPNSRSRLITNGCHWIDHFLFLNQYPEVRTYNLSVSEDRVAVNCSIELENGAFFTMVMTYGGSERIGPQDYVEVIANGRTVRISNESVYLAESSDRLLRRRTINKMLSYQLMYQEVSRKIAFGAAGDSFDSAKGAVELGLSLEELDGPLSDSGRYKSLTTNGTGPERRVIQNEASAHVYRAAGEKNLSIT